MSNNNMEWICYSTPLKQETVLEFLGEEVLDDPVAYPDDAEIARGASFNSLPAKTSRLMETLFLKARIK